MAVVPVRFPISRHPLQGKKPTAKFVHHKLGHLPKHGLPKHRKARLIFLALFIVLIATFAAAEMLRPRMAEQLSEVLPVAWIKAASEQVQLRLDSTLLKPSSAEAERVENLATRFAALAAPASGASPYRLVFRKGSNNGALTYALPDGSIVLTDELLALVPDDLEVLALLCHELGHLHYRHMLRSTLEHEVFLLGTATLFGLESWAVPRLASGFLNSEMSAEANEEADRFAQAMLDQNGIPRQSLSAVLKRLSSLALLRTTQPHILHSPTSEQLQLRLQQLTPPSVR